MMNPGRAPGRGAWARAAFFAVIALLFGCADASLTPPPEGVARLPLEWASLGRMLLGGSGYSVTLLPSGKVLIAGGVPDGADHGDAELYDPDSGAFVAAGGQMTTPRSGHTATLLPSGKVLLAGGDLVGASAATRGGVSAILSSTAELYDPVEDRFVSLGPMRVMRRHHTATLLPSGEVLIIGGDDSRDEMTPGVPTVTAEILPVGPLPICTTTPATDCASVFKAAGDMSVARTHHTATLLRDREVLVVGGFVDAEEHATQKAERYSATTGRFSTVNGSLHDPRAMHSATLMPSGLVLITGSLPIDPKLDGPKPQHHAEVYIPSQDIPSRDAFSPAVPPGAPSLTDFAIPANGASALLPSGEVLIVGAKGSGTSAVLFDDATRSFHAAPATRCAYEGGQTATLLPSADVLLLGGLGPYKTPGCAELYDNSKATIRDTDTSMESARWDHRATMLLSGEVLLTGGTATVGGASQQAQIFDPATLRFNDKPTLTMSTSRSNHTATLLFSGEVLITGGSSADVLRQPDAELYRPACKCFEPVGNLAFPRAGHTATLLASGNVLIVGGTGGDDPAELYDARQSTFSQITGTMPGERSNHTATRLADGRVLIAGGDGLVTATIYDPRANHGMGAFSPTGSMRSGHAEAEQSFAATLLPSGKVLIVGLDAAELFEPDEEGGVGAFSPAAAPVLPAPSGLTSTLLPSGKVLIAGGSWTQVYDPAGDVFTPSEDLWEERVDHTATLLPTGQVLLAGGVNLETGVSLKTSALWAPAVPSASEARRPVLTGTPDEVSLAAPSLKTITGEWLVSPLEGSSGATRASAVSAPIVRVLPVMGGSINLDVSAWGPTQVSFSTEVSKIGGPSLLFVITEGIASEGRPILLRPLTACRSNLDCGVGEVCGVRGTCEVPAAPATPPLSCTCAAAGQETRDPLGAAAAVLLLLGAVLRRRGRASAAIPSSSAAPTDRCRAGRSAPRLRARRAPSPRRA